MFNNEQFRDRVVIIIGAASGMGKQTALQFAELGAKIVITDVNTRINDVFAEIKAQTSCEGLALVADVTKSQSCKDVVAATLDAFGRIDALVNCAGVIQVANDIEVLPEEEWDRVLNVNLKGHFLMAKAAIPQFKKQKSGRIVLITSIWGREGHRYFAAYCASKGGLIMLTHSLAKEMVEHNVNVNSVAPGMINTELHQKSLRDQAIYEGTTYEEVRDKEWAKAPMGYAGDPSDIANGIIFLCSNESKYMTGATLDINGGILMR